MTKIAYLFATLSLAAILVWSTAYLVKRAHAAPQQDEHADRGEATAPQALDAKTPPAGDTNENRIRPPGRWHRVRVNGRAPVLTSDQRRAIEQLDAIGYLAGSVSASSDAGVLTHDRDKAWPGYNFYTSGHAPEALLVDMDGKILHRWSYDYEKLWPAHEVPLEARGKANWRKAHLYPNGDILAIHEGIGMIKLDRDSELLWEFPGRAHHDMDVLEDGSIYVLTHKSHIVPRINPQSPIREDLVTILDRDGEPRRHISILESMENSKFAGLLPRRGGRRDMFHTNAISVLDGRLEDRIPEFSQGNLLISLRNLNAVVVLDPEQESVVWAMTGIFRAQHSPRILENGNMTLFDNKGRGVRSTIYEYDPVTRQPVWVYRGTKEHPFFTNTCGETQRLPNGNTLITESNNGRAFEVTADSTIVWEFLSPHRSGEHGEFVATLFSVERVPAAFVKGWLE